MPLEVPTISDISRVFLTTMTESGLSQVENIDRSFSNILLTAPNSEWLSLGSGIQVRHAGQNVGLFKIAFDFELDPHGASEMHRLRLQMAVLGDALRSMIPPQWRGEFAQDGPDIRRGPLINVTCLAKGVIRRV